VSMSLDELGDRTAIVQLIARYGNCLDRGEFDDLAALFFEDSEFHIDPSPGVESPLRGRSEIREMIERRWQVMNVVEQRRHVMSNIEIIELSGNTAEVRTTLTIFAVERGPDKSVRLHGVGVYSDTIERGEHAWLFRERRLSVDRRDYFAPGWVSAE
jgi:3-phenylpropionate/cinnamic acid dioxygenase small subunit